MTCIFSSNPAWSEPMATFIGSAFFPLLRRLLRGGRPQEVDQAVDEVGELVGCFLVGRAGKPDGIVDVVLRRRAEKVGSVAARVSPGQPGVDRLARRSAPD